MIAPDEAIPVPEPTDRSVGKMLAPSLTRDGVAHARPPSPERRPAHPIRNAGMPPPPGGITTRRDSTGRNLGARCGPSAILRELEPSHHPAMHLVGPVRE